MIGLSQFAGGETLGIFTCKQEFIRKVPGRLVGVAHDKKDRKGFVLTLQTREQHIRRAKATSNICTNHAHNALRAAIYLCLMGPQGVRQVARACVRNTTRLRKALEAIKPGSIAFDGPSFREITVRCAGSATAARDALIENGYFAGVPLSETLGQKYNNLLLVAVTEKRSDSEIDAFAKALGEYL